MGLYEFVDNYSMSIAGALIKKKYFSEGIESRKIKEWFDYVKLDFPKINGEGYYKIKVQYDGVTNDAAFRIEQWKGVQYPTIIYHHGAAEGGYDFSFNRILKKNKNSINANLIAIQALFNHSNKEFTDSIVYLSNYTLMLAVSTLIVENLTNQIRKISNNKIIVTGTSLGGFVANLHFAYYNTADYYKPLLSGARIGEAFINSAYSKITSANGKNNPEKLRHALNFEEDIKDMDQKKVSPLMAKFDQIVKYDVQSLDFNPNQVSIIPFGHATGATKFKLLRQHILKGIDN